MSATSTKRSVIVVGPSGSGKTTAVNALRTPDWRENILVPKRYITRPSRHNDDMEENEHLSHDDFHQLVLEGRIYPSWKRQLEQDRVEYYGFEAHIADNRIRIFSANNAFLRDNNKSTLETSENSLIVLMTANRKVREERLTKRSPDLNGIERELRLADDALDIVKMEGIKVIDTTSLDPRQTQSAFMALIAELIKHP